jgi:hypothetical protein
MEDIVYRLRHVAFDLPSESDEFCAEGNWVPDNVCTKAANEIDRLREKCNSRTRWLQICMRQRYEQLTDEARQFADAIFAEELEPESEPN